MDMPMPNLKGPLSPKGVDFNNQTQAFDFLMDILNDNVLKIEGNTYARRFWYGVIGTVTIAGIFNALQRLLLRSRLRSRNQPGTCKPRTRLARLLATLTALAREIAYLPISSSITRFQHLRTPPTGVLSLLLAYLIFLLALEYVDNLITGAQQWEVLGIRAGWLAVAQIPLIVLLTGKNNLITLLCGVSYERLNILHRWSARMLLLLSTLHFGYQSYNWQKYGLTKLEWTTDTCPPTGIAAYAILLWTNLSTLQPFRAKSYELFIAQHIVSFFGFIIAIILHLPTWTLPSSRVYIYIPIGLYLVDRIIRTTRMFWNNRHVPRATLTRLDENATLIRVSNSAIKRWRPGAHVLVSIPRFGMLQSHPATIMSTPTSHDGDLLFFLKSREGFTRRICENAECTASTSLQPTLPNHVAVLDGPYGGFQYDFAAFDSVLLLAGGTGIAFTLAVLQHLADRLTPDRRQIPLRRVQFIWCIKDVMWVQWFDKDIRDACGKLAAAGTDVEVDAYVTSTAPVYQRNAGGKTNGLIAEKSSTAINIHDAHDRIAKLDVQPSLASDCHLKTSYTTLHSGRPALRNVVEDLLDNADGESAIGVCGPSSMSSVVRQIVVRLSDERAIHKGTDAQGCYLHVESSY